MLISVSDAVHGQKRGRKIGSGADRKRKADASYSQNPHSQKAQKRQEKLSEAQKAVERVKNRERQARSRKLKAAMKDPAYKEMSRDEQEVFLHELNARIKALQYVFSR